MMRINCPEKILKAIALLESNGYSAYAVGGCVRDSIMGRTPNDWDMTTSAPCRNKNRFQEFSNYCNRNKARHDNGHNRLRACRNNNNEG